MGSGKSFFGKNLSDALNISNIDLDLFLEKKENMKIVDIFQQKGEDYFREIENKYLLELIYNKEKYIVSCGGGTPCFFNNIADMNANGVTIYLKRNSDYLYNYLLSSKYKRPVFEMFSSKESFLAHFQEREFFYLKSKLIIHCDNFLSNKEIIENIKNQLYDYRFKK